jgi:hypothetical protein
MGPEQDAGQLGPGGAELDQQPTGQPEGAGAAEQEATYEIGGKEYRASELEQYIAGGMKERDYRQKTAELAEERRTMNEAAEAWRTIQETPELSQALGLAIATMLQGGGQPAGQPGQMPQQQYPQPGQMPQQGPQGPQLPGFPQQQQQPEAWKTEMGQMRDQFGRVLGQYDQRFQEYNNYLWQQYYANKEAWAQSQLPALRQKFPFLVADEVAAAFRDLENANIEEIAQTSHEYWQDQYNAWNRDNVDKRRENASSRVAVPAARSGVAAVQTQTPTTYDQARASAYERLKKIGEVLR